MVPMVPRQEHCSPVPVLCIGGCNWQTWASRNVVTTWVGCPRYPQISPEDITRNLGPDLFGPKCSETVGRSVLFVPLQWPCGVFLR